MDAALLAARLLLAAVFAVAGAAKLADLAGSRTAIAAFGVPERLARPLGTPLPILELATAVALLPTATARAGAISALVLLLLFSAGIAAGIARGEVPDCHCFGQLHSSPAGPGTLARNLALACVAGFAASAAAAPGESIGEALGSLSGIALIVLAALAVVAAAGIWALRERGIPTSSAEAAGQEPAGLPAGSPAPEFSLPGLHGETVTLASLRARGRPVMLLFTDPDCDSCRALLPRIGRWREQHAQRLTIALISRGDAEEIAAEAAEHEVDSVLAEGSRTVSDPYEARPTPSAVLVDRNGRVASALAAGDAAIAALVERATTDPLDLARTPAGT
jgi:peroxiredoxin